MGSLGVCSTEDALQAFLNYLVDPMLPAKSSVNDTPSLSQQQSMARQVHAAALLYNYYHRKEHPQLEFLDFESFCKLAVILKPSLLAHMKFMQRSDDTELSDMEKQISVTEKAIMDACDISKSLDISKNVPSYEGWPITKVTIFLVDSGKENCLLQFGSITQGVWSVIEKELSVPSCSDLSSSMMESKHIIKRKRITKKPLSDPSVEETAFQELAFLALKEEAGFNQSDLAILESHVVYSLSKEKTATCFYIMQCKPSINEGAIQVPIKDVIDSLQGPLVEKCSSNWTATSTIEYFHVLPYAGILSHWRSRNVFSLLDIRVGLKDVSSLERTEKPRGREVNENRDKSHGNCDAFGNNTSSSGVESLEQKDENGCCMNGLLNGFPSPQNMDEDHSYVVCPRNVDKDKNIPDTAQFKLYQKTPYLKNDQTAMAIAGVVKMTPSMENDQTSMTIDGGVKMTPAVKNDQTSMTIDGEVKKVRMVESTMMPFISGCGGEKEVSGTKIRSTSSTGQDGMPIGDHALVTYQSNSKHYDKLQITIASKDNVLSQSALRVLLRKRDKLVHQHRNIEDEIAQCDKNIQKILDGDEDGLALKLESIIEGCNDACSTSTAPYSHKICQQYEDHDLNEYIKKKRLSEATFEFHNLCQELDGICYENNWILPTYRVIPSNSGFEANVTVSGMDFECSCRGDLCAKPREARESAAAKIMTKLKNMASQAQQSLGF